jgi:hypothetical protein
MKAIAKLFETMLTKDATPTWGHQTRPLSFTEGVEGSWGWGGAPEQSWGWGGFTD